MANQITKKATIKESDLPPILVSQQGYVIRYRIVSEDKNRVSHWSPSFTIVPGYTYGVGSIQHSKSGNISTVAWKPVQVKKGTNVIKTASQYDVWVKWDKGDGGNWEYQAQVNTNNISLITPSTYFIGDVDQESAPNKLSVEIFLKGSPITRDSSLLRVYQGGPWTV